MLIVVVIIGILAAALIPRLQSVQGRARDVEKKANLAQIGQAMWLYKQDASIYSGAILSGMIIESKLVPEYLSALPTDKSKKSIDATEFWYVTNSGQYGAWSTPDGGILVLAAITEIRGSSNATKTWFAGTTTMSQVQAKVVAPASSIPDGDPSLRFYYVQ